LGVNLAAEFDCRDLGLLYYAMASSDTLGAALRRASGYSRVTNEAIMLQYREGLEPRLCLSYSGIPRHADRQQIEFCVVAIVRMCRVLSGRQFLPKHVSLMHARSEGISKFASILGDDIEFGTDTDEIAFPAGSAEWTLVNADQRLNKILLKVCEETTFIDVLQQLKANLTSRYLEDDDMPISRIAWLLGFEDASSFSHACRRWTGKSPREFRRFDKAVT
jgi:hypothetical protein